jgi:hypothetical protein
MVQEGLGLTREVRQAPRLPGAAVRWRGAEERKPRGLERGRLGYGRQAGLSIRGRRHGAGERCDVPGESSYRAGGSRCSSGTTGPRRADAHGVPVESNLDRSVAIRPEGLRGAAVEPLDRRRGRMPVWISEPGRHDGDLGSHGIEERLAARRPGSVMGDLEKVDLRQTPGEGLGIDLLLDVSRKQEAPPADLSEQHD